MLKNLFLIFFAWVGSLLNDPISISGTGSMYPTFPKSQPEEVVATLGMSPYPSGISLFGKRYLGYEIKRKDIVVFENEKTKPSGFVKRVIGLPGDKVEIREGLVYLNDHPLNEPYTARARSTFGGEFLSECKPLVIPQNKLFVMGDNRKGSNDSRHDLGLIDYQDIDHVLPFEKQKGTLDKNWRDASKDSEETSKIKLDKNEFLLLLNQKRKENNVAPLKYNLKLEKSSLLRAVNIINTNDSYSMEKSMEDAGYSNIVFGEVPAFGYYEAAELIDHLFAFPETKNFLLNKDFQDIGISIIEGNINNCPTQVIVQQFGGYLPPNYKKEDINGWKKVLQNLQEIQPGWQSLQIDSNFYIKNKAEIDRINEIINVRINNVSSIVKRMEANQWLSKIEKDYSFTDQNLFEEQQNLAKKINQLDPL